MREKEIQVFTLFRGKKITLNYAMSCQELCDRG